MAGELRRLSNYCKTKSWKTSDGQIKNKCYRWEQSNMSRLYPAHPCNLWGEAQELLEKSKKKLFHSNCRVFMWKNFFFFFFLKMLNPASKCAQLSADDIFQWIETKWIKLFFNNPPRTLHHWYNWTNDTSITFSTLTRWQLILQAKPKASFKKRLMIYQCDFYTSSRPELNLHRLGANRTKPLSYGTNKDVYCEVLRKTADFAGG